MASYRKRGKTWQYTISYTDKETGKPEQIYKGGFRTKTEAIGEAEELEQSIKKGVQIKNNITLAEHFESWISMYKERQVTPTTVLKYKQSLSHIKELFPDIPLSQVNRSIYQTFLNNYADKHVKESTLRIHGHIKQSIQVAIDDKIITDDFTRRAIISGKKESKPANQKFISYSDTKKLLKYLVSHREPSLPNNYLLMLAFTTGLRYGELTGLTWNDIDFENQRISVNKSYDYLYHTGFKPTKTETSKRTVDIDEFMTTLLRELRDNQKKEFKSLEVKNPLNLVFYHFSDGVPSNSGTNKLLKTLLQRLEISPLISVHGARHTYGSILIYKGVDIGIVSEVLGHKDVTITNEVYRHVIKELREENRERLLGIQNELFM
ncbi:site-specific integrase [Enterococcus sp. BWR-S5]|uniref:site-specific integrase n=1 Tax=Enterococcus sp. BWR-S5 TaxID=2787714 RepID=UPI001921C0A6|nr:tyrosine-type recombinase/integrase [Enterococcus sp. BWR-S5]MBL1223916.1 site-specific integrase [Enterococcus sp. BWR-S5]